MSRERKMIVAYMRARAEEVGNGRTDKASAHERSMLKRRLNNIAEEIEQGMHL
jgi:hypothetical protein